MNKNYLSIIMFFLIAISCKANNSITNGEWYNGYGSDYNKSKIFLTGTLNTEKLTVYYEDSLIVISGQDTLKTGFNLVIKNTDFKISIDIFGYYNRENREFIEKELNDIIKVILPFKIKDSDIKKIFISDFKRVQSDFEFSINSVVHLSDYRRKDVARLFFDFYKNSPNPNNKNYFYPFETIFILPNLKSLSLINYKGDELPDRFEEFKELTELEIKNDGYTSPFRFDFPQQILKIQNLKKLKIQGVSTLPDELGKLEKLEYLEISYSSLNNIPKSLGELSNIKQLEIYHSQVSSFPTEIAQLSKLEDLKIRGNYLSRTFSNIEYPLIPQEVWKLKQLKYLHLDGIDKRTLPNFKVKLDSIQTIKLTQAYTTYNAESNKSYNEKYGNLIITEVPLFLFNLKSLNLLIYNITVSEIPEELFELKDVRVDLYIKSGVYKDTELEALKKRYEDCCVKNKDVKNRAMLVLISSY